MVWGTRVSILIAESICRGTHSTGRPNERWYTATEWMVLGEVWKLYVRLTKDFDSDQKDVTVLGEWEEVQESVKDRDAFTDVIFNDIRKNSTKDQRSNTKVVATIEEYIVMKWCYWMNSHLLIMHIVSLANRVSLFNDSLILYFAIHIIKSYCQNKSIKWINVYNYI